MPVLVIGRPGYCVLFVSISGAVGPHRLPGHEGLLGDQVEMMRINSGGRDCSANSPRKGIGKLRHFNQREPVYERVGRD